MSENISVAQAILDDPTKAASEIDRVLQACWVKARPVYIGMFLLTLHHKYAHKYAWKLTSTSPGLPTNVVFREVDAKLLETPLDLEIPPNNTETEDEVVSVISDLIYKSSNTIILADACAIRHRVLDELHELIEKTELPAFVSPMGKGAINEESLPFGGVYVGDASRDDVRQRVDGAELILYIGGLQSDFNSGGFTYHIAKKSTVEFHSDHTKVIQQTSPPDIHALCS